MPLLPTRFEATQALSLVPAPPHGVALMDTAVGRCAIAWGPRGVKAFQLPEATDDRTVARLQRHTGGLAVAAPPAAVRQAIDDITALLEGQPRDLRDIALDFDGIAPFHRRVYQAARDIPPGQTRTYGEVAEQIGEPGAARAVGQALGLNPFAIIVPCHRVLAAGGRSGGFSANGGVSTKLRILLIEQAQIGDQPGLF